MSKKEIIFPLNTFGGRMQDLRKNRLNISRPEFYDLIFPNGNVATESKSRTVKNWESGNCEPDIKTIHRRKAQPPAQLVEWDSPPGAKPLHFRLKAV